MNHYDSGLEPELVVPETNYADMFIKTAQMDPSAPAIHFMGVTISYGKLDEDGYFTIADRVKDMLIVGGYKVLR